MKVSLRIRGSLTGLHDLFFYAPSMQKEREKITKAEIEQFITLETDPMAKERIKLLPPQVYKEVMAKYQHWREQLMKLISPVNIPHIFERYQEPVAEKQCVCPHCPFGK